ncbi:Non-structural maintenance of chromosomes element [Dirofilaria immitis]
MGESSNSNSSKNLLRIIEDYSVPHKHLVQLIIKHGILQTHYFCKKFVQYVQVYDPEGNTITQPDDGEEKIFIEKLIVVINNALAPLSLRLVQADDEYDDRNSYIILLSDRRPNDFLRDAFGLTQTEFALFHLWVNAICSSENGEISKCEALSIASDLLVKGKKVDEEYLLQQFVLNKWLAVDNERATIRLDTRGIAELQNYFNSHADELKLKKCVVCGKFIVIKNRAIFCKMCGSFCHRQCGLKITKSVKTEKVRCPGTLASGESCSTEFHLSVEVESVNENQKDDFDEQDEY